MKRKIKPNTGIRFRRWQGAAYSVFADMNTINHGCLVNATPGAGKTIFGLGSFIRQYQALKVSKLVVVVPQDKLRMQWADVGHKLGLNLLPMIGHRNTYGFNGIVMTYQQLDGMIIQLTRYCQVNNVMLICDEIHHAGEKKSWGNGLLESFSLAPKKLLLSGTPFRHDENKIAFVRYDKNNTSIVDYSYSYPDAVSEGVCRPVVFHSEDAAIVYDKNGKMNAGRVSEGLEHSLTIATMKGNFLKHLIKKSDSLLDKAREESDPNAGGIVFCRDQTHAYEVQGEFLKILGYQPDVVVSDSVGSHKLIDKFRASSARWIISVRMISEGVDIPRLRVGLFITNYTTRLFFIQALGRICRGDGFAYFVFPAAPALAKIAAQINKEMQHVVHIKPLPDKQAELFDDLFSDEDPGEGEKKNPIYVHDVELVGSEIFFNGESLFLDEGKYPELPLYEYLMNLKVLINRNVNNIAMRVGVPPAAIHNEWITNLKQPAQDDCSPQELKQKFNWSEGRLSYENSLCFKKAESRIPKRKILTKRGDYGKI